MTKITQLFEKLELFSEGDPPHHALFVMGRVLGAPEQLLLIDPPDDAAHRFALAEQTAVLFTGPKRDVGLPQVEAQVGSVAHLRVGQHLLDVYPQQQGAVVELPAVGVLCGGDYGSDLALPALAPASQGDEEIETLRLLAQLVKGKKLQLYIPRIGSLSTDRVEVMTRLANDVSYLHGLRRVAPAAARRGDTLAQVQELALTLLPENRRFPLCLSIHRQNVERLYRASHSDSMS